MAYITIRIKGEEGFTRLELDKDRMVIGRASTCTVPIKHSSISREHCALLKDGETWFVEDLGSANGVRVNAAKVAGRMALKERDIVKVGRARLTFHLKALGQAEEAAISLADDADDEAEAKAPLRLRGMHDPAQAIPCDHCGSWFSVAHRSAGERMPCPRCKHTNMVPRFELAPSQGEAAPVG